MNALAEQDTVDEALINLNNYFTEGFVSIKSLPDSSVNKNSPTGVLDFNGTQLPYVSRPAVTSKRLVNLAGKSDLPAETIFVVPFVDPADRVACRERNINYLDSAGNCRIVNSSINWIIDAASARPLSPLALGRGFKYNGLKLIYACYESPELLRGSYRKMSEATGISLGAVSGILEDLRKDEFLLTKQDGTHEFHHARELVQRWAYAYLDEVLPATFRSQLVAMDEDYLERIDGLRPEDGVQVGGERAAMARSGYLRSPNFSIHTDLRLGELVKKLRLSPFNRAPRDAKIIDLYSTFYKTPGKEFVQQRMEIPITGDLIILAELLKTHKARQLEAADQLLNYEIRDRFEALGFQW